MVSVYVGLKDGAFRQTRRVDPGVQVQDKMPPADAKYAYRWVLPGPDGHRIDHYEFLDANRPELGSTRADHALRPARRGCGTAPPSRPARSTITDPDVFAALGLIGFTVVAPFYNGGKLAGVAATDFTLDGLGALSCRAQGQPRRP